MDGEYLTVTSTMTKWVQSALPSVPDIPGWHFCWLSTTNSYDSIDKRISLGYIPVKAVEMPSMKNNRVKTGAHKGFIACNEMLLYKISIDLYLEIMSHSHHEAPLRQAHKIRIQRAKKLNKSSC